MGETKVNFLELAKTLKTKKEEVLATENPKYNCSDLFRPNQYTDRGSIDIPTASMNQIISATKSILLHKEACEKLEVDAKHNGYTVEEWFQDFKLRVAVLNRANTLKEIQQLETQVNSLLNTDERRELTGAEILEKLSKL